MASKAKPIVSVPLSQAMKGNSNGVKIKDADIRQLAFDSFCEHIADGYPKQAWFFEHETHSCCWETMESYIRNNPAEFPAHKMRAAFSKRYKKWFKKGEDFCDGKLKGNASPVVWQTIMRNMFKDYGWDVQDDPTTLIVKTSADIMVEKMLGVDGERK